MLLRFAADTRRAPRVFEERVALFSPHFFFSRFRFADMLLAVDITCLLRPLLLRHADYLHATFRRDAC